MSVTGVVVAEREEKLRQVERVVGSELLHGSESLCKLLRYLAEHCIDHPGAAVKEYQIATELFKRPQDFDPRLDATVRVQTGRLRSKLSEYYAGPGQNGRGRPGPYAAPQGVADGCHNSLGNFCIVGRSHRDAVVESR